MPLSIPSIEKGLTLQPEFVATPSILTNAEHLGQGVMQRLAAREKSRIQFAFLQELQRLPASRYLTLCGGAALHGVYLHERWSKDLDFYAPYIIADRFPEIVAKAGLAIHRVEGRSGYAFFRDGIIAPRMGIGIEIFVRGNSVLAPTLSQFRSYDGQEITLQVAPLAEILLSKVGCLHRRSKPTDFVDLWSALKKYPDILLQMRLLLNDSRWNCGIYTPPRQIDIHRIMANLSSLQDTWDLAMMGIFYPQPSFAVVAEELSDSLCQLQSS